MMEKTEREKIWNPEKYQDELSKSPSQIRGVIGGNRTGKTEWGAREVYYYATGTHPYKSVTVPNEIWIGTPSFDTQVESAQPKLLKFLKKEDIFRIEYYLGTKIKTIFLTNGGKITFKSYEQSVDKWMGAEKRLIWFDEEPPHAFWTEAVVRHGAGVKLEIIFTLTPINGMTWIYDDIWQQAEAKGITIKTPSWEDNSHLTREQIDLMTTQLSAEELEVRKYGRFIRRIGLICNWWRRDVHIENLSTFNPQGKTIYVGIDFGFTTSFTCALFAAIQDDDIYIFDGLYEKGLTTGKLAKRLKEKLGDLFIHKWIADSAAAEDIAELQEYGIKVNAIEKQAGGSAENWDEFRAKKMAQIGQLSPITGRSRLHIASHLITSIEGRAVNFFANEAENVRWKEVRTADGSKAKSIWSDEKNKDCLDAFSYILVSMPMQVEKEFTFTNKYDRKRLVPKEQLFDRDGFYL